MGVERLPSLESERIIKPFMLLFNCMAKRGKGVERGKMGGTSSNKVDDYKKMIDKVFDLSHARE